VTPVLKKGGRQKKIVEPVETLNKIEEKLVSNLESLYKNEILPKKRDRPKKVVSESKEVKSKKGRAISEPPKVPKKIVAVKVRAQPKSATPNRKVSG
jgi:hypothetical protein